MLLNADFSVPIVVEPERYAWVPSPQPGVERIMLDRVGGEMARATSLVRYAPGASFPAHVHAGGEEILVLSGTFCEEQVEHPAGWYLRSPPGSAHASSTTEGAVIFVKLGQMAPSEQKMVRVNTCEPLRWNSFAGRQRCPLFHSSTEQVSLDRIDAAQPMFDGAIAGAEILVLAGELMHEQRMLSKGSWVRLPAGRYPGIIAGAEGATLYLKTGPLGLEFGMGASTWSSK